MAHLAVFLAVVLTYVHVFNHVAEMYFDSGETMTWNELYRRFVPPTNLQIQF
jgi:hypothetical protein